MTCGHNRGRGAAQIKGASTWILTLTGQLLREALCSNAAVPQLCLHISEGGWEAVIYYGSAECFFRRPKLPDGSVYPASAIARAASASKSDPIGLAGHRYPLLAPSDIAEMPANTESTPVASNASTQAQQ